MSSIPLRRGAVLAVIAVSLSACATTERLPQSSSAPVASSTAAPAQPALDCSTVLTAVLGDLDLEPFAPVGDTSAILAASVGGVYCGAEPTPGSPTEATFVDVAILPADIVAGAAELREGCGDLGVAGPGCTARLSLPDVVAEVVVHGPPTDSVTALLDEVTQRVSALLDGGARPADATPAATAFDAECQDVDLSTAGLPEALGAFGEWGGSDAGTPHTELLRVIAVESSIMTGCTTVSEGGIVVGLSALAGGESLLADERVIGEGERATLPSGRRAVVGAAERRDGRDVIRIITESGGAILVVSVGVPDSETNGTPVTDAAPMIADGIAALVDEQP